VRVGGGQLLLDPRAERPSVFGPHALV
jgi:hypothetical protein